MKKTERTKAKKSNKRPKTTRDATRGERNRVSRAKMLRNGRTGRRGWPRACAGGTAPRPGAWELRGTRDSSRSPKWRVTVVRRALSPGCPARARRRLRSCSDPPVGFDFADFSVRVLRFPVIKRTLRTIVENTLL